MSLPSSSSAKTKPISLVELSPLFSFTVINADSKQSHLQQFVCIAQQALTINVRSSEKKIMSRRMCSHVLSMSTYHYYYKNFIDELSYIMQTHRTEPHRTPIFQYSPAISPKIIFFSNKLPKRNTNETSLCGTPNVFTLWLLIHWTDFDRGGVKGFTIHAHIGMERFGNAQEFHVFHVTDTYETNAI